MYILPFKHISFGELAYIQYVVWGVQKTDTWLGILSLILYTSQGDSAWGLNGGASPDPWAGVTTAVSTAIHYTLGNDVEYVLSWVWVLYIPLSVASRVVPAWLTAPVMAASRASLPTLFLLYAANALFFFSLPKSSTISSCTSDLSLLTGDSSESPRSSSVLPAGKQKCVCERERVVQVGVIWAYSYLAVEMWC